MAGTTNKELTTVVTVLNKASRVWRWIPSAPKLLHVDGDVREAYPITWEEQDRLFGELNVWEMFAALFAINTGVRKSELFGLRWEDMRPIPSLDTFVFILRDTKNSQDRAVICNSIARRAVYNMRESDSEFIFPARFTMPAKDGSRYECKIRQSGKVWAQAWRRAGLPSDKLTRAGIHNLRHSAGARLRAADVPEEDRGFLLGHNNASLVQHYALPSIERLSAMAERITTRKESILLR
jgi:integrase